MFFFLIMFLKITSLFCRLWWQRRALPLRQDYESNLSLLRFGRTVRAFRMLRLLKMSKLDGWKKSKLDGLCMIFWYFLIFFWYFLISWWFQFMTQVICSMLFFPLDEPSGIGWCSGAVFANPRIACSNYCDYTWLHMYDSALNLLGYIMIYTVYVHDMIIQILLYLYI